MASKYCSKMYGKNPYGSTSQLMSTVDFMELSWTQSDYLKTFMKAIVTAERMAVKRRDLNTKRIISTMRQGTLHVLKELQTAKVELGKCSFEVFKRTLRKGEFYTMFCRKNLPVALTELLFSCCAEDTEEQSSPCATTETTSMSCTTVPTQMPHAAAPPSSSSATLAYPSTSGADRRSWINCTIYFSKEGRELVYLDVARRNWVPSGEARCVQLQQDLSIGQEKLVEGLGTTVDFCDSKCGGSEAYGSAASHRDGGQGVDGNSGSEARGKGDAIVDFLRRYPTAPITHVFGLSVWLNSRYKFYNRQSPLMANILKIVSNSYNELSVSELCEFFGSVEPQNLIFNAPMGNVSAYYYGPQESLAVCEKLVNYQFNDDRVKILNFYKCLINVLDRRVPKKNSSFVLSPPNAGKKFFFDACIHFCVNFGQMGNFNRYCTFPLMECVNRRVILWNEPVMEASASETLKCILGGDTCNAKVKYQGDAVIFEATISGCEINYISLPKNYISLPKIFTSGMAPVFIFLIVPRI